jgi:hypothetical protein
MGLVGTSIRMVQVPDWQVLAEDLNVRTGLSWTIHDNSRSNSTPWKHCTLRVARFNWEVDLTRRANTNIIEVELMPLGWPAVNYHYWQVLAALQARGGTLVSGNEQIRVIKFPRWISCKWDELPWWCRYPG